MCHARHDAVKRSGCPALKKSLALPGHAFRRNDIVSFLEQSNHFGQKLWRVLKVRVHDHNGVALGKIESRSDGCLMPEVAAETDCLYSRVRLSRPMDNFQRIVRAAIV